MARAAAAPPPPPREAAAAAARAVRICPRATGRPSTPSCRSSSTSSPRWSRTCTSCATCAPRPLTRHRDLPHVLHGLHHPSPQVRRGVSHLDAAGAGGEAAGHRHGAPLPGVDAAPAPRPKEGLRARRLRQALRRRRHRRRPRDPPPAQLRQVPATRRPPRLCAAHRRPQPNTRPGAPAPLPRHLALSGAPRPPAFCVSVAQRASRRGWTWASSPRCAAARGRSARG